MQRIEELCRELSLAALAALYPVRLRKARPKRQDASYADFLEEVLRAERDARRARSREMFTRTAGFPAIKTLDAYDFGFATGAPRKQILELASAQLRRADRECRAARTHQAPARRILRLRLAISPTQRGWKMRFTSAADLMLDHGNGAAAEPLKDFDPSHHRHAYKLLDHRRDQPSPLLL